MLLILPLLFAGYIDGADWFFQQYDERTWYVGEDMGSGDYFVYDVCDAIVFRDGSCYVIRLDFYAKLASPTGDTWVVQAEITDDMHNTAHHIFLIDSDTLDIKTDYLGSIYARSVENTIFYLSKFAVVNNEKDLGVGSVWGMVPSSLGESELHVAYHDVISFAQSDLDVSVLEYWVFRSSTFAVSEQVGLPISASVYDQYATLDDPFLAFAFTLTDYSVGGKQ